MASYYNGFFVINVMNAASMIKIGLHIFLALLVSKSVHGQSLLNEGHGQNLFTPLPNQPRTSGADGQACPPCSPSDCDIRTGHGHSSTISADGPESEHIFGANNTSDSSHCTNAGVPLLDDCGCCTICVRKPNETCGGIARRLGTCQPGSTCWPVSLARGVLLNGSESGICIELLDDKCATPIESKGCNLHAKRGCVCATVTACQAVEFQYGDENECRKDWRKLKAMWQHECLKAKCNVVFQPHCPPDSVFAPAPPPEPPDCCQKPGSCQCLPDACPSNELLKPCPHGSDLVLARKASGKPGSCCDVYECHSRGDECSGVICPTTADAEIDASAEAGALKNDASCPADSFRPLTIRGKDRCCPVKDECRCRPGLCRPADCASGFRVIVRKKGSGLPGACCDEFECVEESEPEENHNTGTRRPTTCKFEGKEYEGGETWRPSACIECKCNDGVNLCRKMECAPSTCTRMAVPDGECCPVCIGCTSEDGEVHNVTDEWQKDDCTTCGCEPNGQVLCQKQLCKVECDHPVKVAGECCPKCDNISTGERDHYDQTSTLEPPHSMSSSRRNCSTFDGLTCLKKCAHGYQHDAIGCPTCKCKGCPPMHQCYKHCLHGFQTNIYGCPICKCKGAKLESSASKPESRARFGSQSNDLSSSPADLSACHSMTGGIRDHGEWWFDGCRHCYCDNGLEYCSLLACPPLNCTDPIFEDGECCPKCPGSSQEGLVQRLVCHAPGSGRSYVEGEYWDLEPCVRCTCHIGHVLCHKKLCPPAPCSNPTTPKGHCCPVCEDLRLPEPGLAENVTFCQSSSAASAYADGSIWKQSPCESCMCRDTNINCFQQACPLIGCTGRLLQVKHECCPVCTANLENGACRFSDAVVYSVGEQWRDGPCRNCSCVGDGETLCTQVECPRCFNATPIPGQCCPQCNDEEVINSELDWKTWTPMPSSTYGTNLPELPGANNPNPQTSLVLVSCIAGIFAIFVAIVLIVCWCRKRRQHSHHGGGFGFFKRNGGSGGARLTNFPGYDPAKSMPAIVNDRNNYPYEQTKMLLNTDVNGDVVKNGNNNTNRFQPDILRRGNDYDERNSRAVQNGTLLYDYEVGGWDVGKV